jgi:cytochrome bd-type quinol oxidase subunit 2
MGNTFKEKLKFIGAYIWSLFKGSILPSIMYFCASAILMMLVIKGEKIDWTNSDITWTVVCVLGGVAYNALAAWANGGSHYEMLVSGNVKRSAYDAYGNPYKMSTHKIVKEYRVWKGFAVGCFVAIIPILFGILLGANQEAIHSGGEASKDMGILVILAFLFSGWSVLPFYCMNQAGMAVSYYYSMLFAILPILVSGVVYIAGAYARRNKAIRQQELAEMAAKAEEEKKKNKKINYGGLPGTKPKKHK